MRNETIGWLLLSLPGLMTARRPVQVQRSANTNQESQNQQLTLADNPLPFGCG